MSGAAAQDLLAVPQQPCPQLSMKPTFARLFLSSGLVQNATIPMGAQLPLRCCQLECHAQLAAVPPPRGDCDNAISPDYQ
jgi:hypothetical protein